MIIFLKSPTGIFLKAGGSCLAIYGPGPRPEDEVKIGNQIWSKKNLDYDDGGEGIQTYTVNYGHGDVTEHYYSWDAAVRVASSIPGWHLPSDAEYAELLAVVGGYTVAGTKLKATYGWAAGAEGTDNYGFCILPAGLVNKYGTMSNVGTSTSLWTADSTSWDSAKRRSVTNKATIYNADDANKTMKMIIRLVKDS